jgi:DNA (cytosine-5)-methyltransferase 1
MTTFIDLFCGIGSFHQSFKSIGFKCVMACDINVDARNTYEKNHNIKPLGDIIDINPEEIESYDILCAGFPCQPFSQCGKQKGFDDPRGTLFFQVMKFVKTNRPKFVILENVQSLLSHDKGVSFEKIKNELIDTDYIVHHKVLLCSDYGIPQMRKRLFIIGVRSDIAENSDKIMNFDKFRSNVSLSQFLDKQFEKKTAYTIRCGGKNSPINDKHNWDGYIVNGKEYRLSIDDCLKLQGFDSTFTLCGSKTAQWKQLGNTIPTIFTEMIGTNIKEFINNRTH